MQNFVLILMVKLVFKESVALAKYRRFIEEGARQETFYGGIANKRYFILKLKVFLYKTYVTRFHFLC